VIAALIVDDEAPARDELRYLLGAHPDVVVVGEAPSPRAALELLGEAKPDVVFLDVEMPGATGLSLAPLVRERAAPPAVVFVTAHAEYAVDAFAVEAFDYLLKPVDPDQIHYVQADGDYSRIHTYDRAYLCTSSLGALEERLGPRFARVHRSHVVNLAKVTGVRREPDKLRLQLADAERTELDVARRQARLLRDRLRI